MLVYMQMLGQGWQIDTACPCQEQGAHLSTATSPLGPASSVCAGRMEGQGREVGGEKLMHRVFWGCICVSDILNVFTAFLRCLASTSVAFAAVVAH